MRYTPLLVVILVLAAGCVAAVHRCALESIGQEPAPASPSEVDVVGCLTKESGKLKLTDDEGNVYHLIGHTAELKNHIGDQLDVGGIQDHPPTPLKERSLPETTLRVTNVETVLHVSPSGVRPLIGDVATWDGYTDHDYGVRFRYPKAFETFEHRGIQDPHVESNFINQDRTLVVSFESLGIPPGTYPNSNFEDGSFTALVNPRIRSEGTCRQFSSFWPEHTSTRTIHGIKYSQTLSVGVAAGSVSSVYSFHTFQNGFCYEFDFAFDARNTTGMMLTCSTQWVSERNEFELMEALLSQVRFFTPKVKPAVTGKPSGSPTVVSFEHSPVNVNQSSSVEVSWTTQGADYVRLHHPCVKQLIVSEILRGGDMKCGGTVDRNFPPNGSVSLRLANFNSDPVQLDITVEPFLDGTGYPEKSKTLTISVSPHPKIR